MVARLGALKNLINHASTSHLGIKGGTSAQHEFISATAQELRIFLEEYKGKHISVEEIQGFYRQHFPHMNLEIENKQTTRFMGLDGPEAVACTQSTEDLSQIEKFKITIHSKSILDKLKDLFHIENKNKDFYVSSEFVNTLVHEGTHVMQDYLKPSYLTFRKSLKKKCVDERQCIDAIVDYKLAYNEVDDYIPLIFIPRLWAKGLVKKLKKCEYSNNPEIVPDALKMCIRGAQSEKEAYALGQREGIKFIFPRIARTSVGNKILDLYPKITASNPFFRYNDKIRALKREYFKMIEAERQKHRELLQI